LTCSESSSLSSRFSFTNSSTSSKSQSNSVIKGAAYFEV
jgi:hypothetical protein